MKIQNTKYKILNMAIGQSGITLLELMVSVFLFSITMVLAAGIFQTVIKSQRIAVASEDLQENMRYSFERMGKEIRTGQKDFTHVCIPAGYNIYYSPAAGQLQFLNYHGQCVRYYINNKRFYVSYPNSSDLTLKNGLPLTPKEVIISKLGFRIVDNSKYVQGGVTLRMHLAIGTKAISGEQIDVETFLSLRNYQ